MTFIILVMKDEMLQSQSRLTEVTPLAGSPTSHQSPAWAGTRSLLAECSGVEIVEAA